MSNKHQEFMSQLLSAVCHGQGVTDQSLRTAVKRAVASGSEQLESDDSTLPADLRRYLYKVSRHAYRITDRDMETLKGRGYSEDAIFELTVSAAVGAGLGRLDQGLAALGEADRPQREASDEVK